MLCLSVQSEHAVPHTAHFGVAIIVMVGLGLGLGLELRLSHMAICMQHT